MKINAVIRAIMLDKKLRIVNMSDLLDLNQGTISARLNHVNMSMNTVLEMLDPLGYELIARPKLENLQKDEFLITK